MTGAKDMHICYVFIYLSIIIYLSLYGCIFYLSLSICLPSPISMYLSLSISVLICLICVYLFLSISLYLYTLHGCIWSLLSLSLSTFIYLYPPFRFYLFVSTYVALHFTFLYHSVFTYLCLQLRMLQCLCILPIQLMEIMDRSSTQFLIVQELDFFIRGLAFGELNNTRVKTGGKTNFSIKIHK